MTDNDFWIKFWRTIACMVVAIAMCIAGYHTADTLVTNAAIADMVSKGADPQAAACAVGKHHGSGCLLLAAKEVTK